MKALNFLKDKDGRPILRDGSSTPAAGEVLRHNGDLMLRKSGLHASKRPFDALTYAPGKWLCRVERGACAVFGVVVRSRWAMHVENDTADPTGCAKE